MSLKIKNICCIGAGYVGGPSMAVFADKLPNIKINVLDLNKERIAAWNNKDLEKLPIYEPGLSKLVEKNRNKNLFFSSDLEKNISEADMIFISVNTPTKTSGLGAGQASDLRWVESCTRAVAKYAKNHTIVIEKSTIPVKTAELIKNLLDSYIKKEQKYAKVHKSFSILSNPEFLAEGNAINDLKFPDRILIGGEDIESVDSLKILYERWVPTEKIICTNLWSSELSKLAANAFLAQRISSINSISAICESTGASIDEVSLAIGADTRIGNKFISSSPGFGGSCFKKDILNLIYLCDFNSLFEVSKYWQNVLTINEWQKKRVSKLIVEKLFGTLYEKKIGVLGFAFKANTNDTRESPAIDIVADLIVEKAQVAIYDPKVQKESINMELNNILQNFKNSKNDYLQDSKLGEWACYEEIDDVFKNSDAIVILTEWDEFKTIDWNNASNLMRYPAWVFDTRSIINEKEVKESGLNLWVLGKSL
tara:strand:+ start:827 stop:2266 length:1440 start_codon:yes stop_codon:yes gene_type:complete